MFTVGQVLSDYRVVGPLGQPGGFGAVYKAQNIHDNSEAALKECYGRNQDEIDRFEVENSILHKLLTHNFIIKPLSKIATEGTVKYYLMELADECLTDFLNRNYNLSVDDKIDLFIKICEGVNYAHSKEVTHRDIWWNNVLLISQPQLPITPKITDFGRGRDFNTTQLTSTPPQAWGYKDISQPELYFRYWEDPTHLNYILGDIYALGILLYYSLGTAALPYSYSFVHSVSNFFTTNNIDVSTADESVRQKAYDDWLPTLNYTYLDNLRSLPALPPTFFQKIDPIIKKACHPDFRQRYQSIDDFLVDLRSI